jgi:3-oxoacyl-[acyl-carrier protein] reductase
MATDLAGRRLLVAGDPPAATVMADGASRCGAVVALVTDTSGDALPSTQADAIRYNGASEADVERAIDQAIEKTGGVDVLMVVIEAVSMPPLDEEDLASWERCITRPLRTTFWLVRRVAHELLAAGLGGQIVLVVAGEQSERRAASAWIVEGALLSLARSIAKEYGRRAITCNVIAGGSIPAAQCPTVEAALFLASPAAGFVTGECLRVAEDSIGCA